MTTPTTRRATADDAEAAVRVLRESITVLCVEDHQNDPSTLEQWLRNKTVEQFRAWVVDPELYVVVAEHEASIAGVGSLHATGEIRLCYVQPGFQGLGLGRALLAALEHHARSIGLARLRLKSSVGAQSFYEHAGYVSTGPATCGPGSASCFPLERSLDAE
jgi:GNAT superfamily N-acetyltransferase